MRRLSYWLIGLCWIGLVWGAGIQRVPVPVDMKEGQSIAVYSGLQEEKEKDKGKEEVKGKHQRKKVEKIKEEEGDTLSRDAIQWKYSRFEKLFMGFGVGLAVGWIADFLVTYGIFYDRAYFFHVLMKVFRVFGVASYLGLVYIWFYFLGWHFAYLYRGERDWRAFLRCVFWGLLVPTLAWLLQLWVQMRLWNSVGG